MVRHTLTHVCILLCFFIDLYIYLKKKNSLKEHCLAYSCHITAISLVSRQDIKNIKYFFLILTTKFSNNSALKDNYHSNTSRWKFLVFLFTACQNCISTRRDKFIGKLKKNKRNVICCLELFFCPAIIEETGVLHVKMDI